MIWTKKLRIYSKNSLYFLFGESITNVILKLWRTLYWFQRRQISPRKNKKIVRKLVEKKSPIKLELGSPKRLGMEDWIASDINKGGDIQLDFTQPIPFPDNSVDCIYSSHVLEHFSYPNTMLNLLRECHRILKVGGSLSIAVPNAKIFLDAYACGDLFEKNKYCSYDVGLKYKYKIDYVNFIAYMGGDHKHMFDEENLVGVLEEAGFGKAKIRDFDPSIDLEVRRHESIYAEGIK
jgi:predicted SAM-dependent methyltransferase